MSAPTRRSIHDQEGLWVNPCGPSGFRNTYDESNEMEHYDDVKLLMEPIEAIILVANNSLTHAKLFRDQYVSTCCLIFFMLYNYSNWRLLDKQIFSRCNKFSDTRKGVYQWRGGGEGWELSNTNIIFINAHVRNLLFKTISFVTLFFMVCNCTPKYSR